MIVWRGLIEASYLEDARVGELLRQRGKTLEAIAYLIGLWRSYPNTASIESDFFGLSQVVAQTASQAFTNPGLRREMASCRRHPVGAAAPVDPHDPGLSVAIAQEPGGRRGQSRASGGVHRSRGLQGGRQAGGPVRQALSQEHLSRQLPVQRGAGQLSPGPVRPRDRSRRDDRPGDLQRRRPASTSPAPTSGRPFISWARFTTPAASPARRSNTIARWPTGSATPPARSSHTPART